MSTTQPPGLRVRANSVRARWGSNQWNAWAAATKSTLASSSVVASAVPATLVKRGVPSQPALGRPSHLPVGLDPEDAVAVREEQFAQDARPGAHVRDDGGAGEPAFHLKELQDFTRVRGAIFGVVLDPALEALRRVGGAHSGNACAP